MTWSSSSADRLRKLRALSSGEWIVLIQAVFLLSLIKLSVKWSGLRQTQRLLARLSNSRNLTTEYNHTWSRRAGELVSIAARRRWIRANCLAQSLCLWFLMRRRGLDTQLRIGVSTAGGSFTAHAWVEQAGVVITNDTGTSAHYAPFDGAIDFPQTGAA